MTERSDGANEAAIAIIGMACRFPGAPDPATYWDNLRDGVDCRTALTDEELAAAGVAPALAADPSYVRAAYVLDDVDAFDAAFFGYSPREAELMDPQHRLFLECAWQALEDAGCLADLQPRAVGVFASARLSTYLLNNVPRDAPLGSGDGFQALIGNDKDYLPTRVSYKLNLRGPSVAVQTACSSSLVAVHLACESLRSGESELALAGGVAVSVPQRAGYLFQEGMIFAPDGRCRPFDASAAGTAIGNGLGAVVLKRLADAIEDGDPIHAVIRGTAVNNDGAAKIGFTAPSIEGQQRVIGEALAMAGVGAGTVGYVEAHGTGTPLGDPIEIEALTRAYRSHTAARGYCAIGSVKGNLGHMDTAAGIASLIKTTLALKHAVIPPLMHYQAPNPRIDFDGSPFFVPTRAMAWERTNGTPRRAAVSSFGIGGTNSHAVLEEAPERPPAAAAGEGRRHQILTLSARSPGALRALAGAHAARLGRNGTMGSRASAEPGAQVAAGSLRDLCVTANTRASHHPWRAAVVAASVDQMAERLTALSRGEAAQGVAAVDRAAPARPRIAFLFSGQGSQVPGMGRGLYEAEEPFRAALDRCAAIVDPLLPVPLLSVLYGPESGRLLGMTRFTQPALFAVEYALSELWRSWGVEPSFVLGHSVGEYAAACVSGVMSLEDGIRLIAERGRLIGDLPEGGEMAALLASEEAVRGLLARAGGPIAVAALNGPDQVVVSGARDAVRRVLAAAEAEGLMARPLAVSHAFHSPLLDPVLERFGEVAAKATLAPPRIPLVSNVTGRLAGPEIARPEYWVRHLRDPVRFGAGVAALGEAGANVFLEVGPDEVLTAMGRRCLEAEGTVWLGSLKAGYEDQERMLEATAGLYAAGADPRWDRLERAQGSRRVQLPAYPFERKRHWLSPRRQEVEGQPQERRAAVESWRTLVEAGTAAATEGAGGLRLAAYSVREACLRKLSHAYVGRALARLGAFRDGSERATIEALRQRLPIQGRYHQMLGRLLDRLVDGGHLHRDGAEYWGLAVVDPRGLEALVAEAGSHAREVPEILAFVRRCGESFAEVLSGAANPRAIIFPDGSVETLERVYENTAEAKYLNAIAAALAGRAAEAVPAAGRVRALEIGGGVGGTTAWVLPALPADRTSYTFTDVSPLFLRNAEERFGGDRLRCRLLDIERPPQEQGFAPRSFDLVIASNVLHVTRNLDRAMEHVRSLLAPGGLLLIREITRDIPWFDYTLGTLLQELDDGPLRGGRPFLSVRAWRDLLGSHGFERVAAFPGDGTPSEVIGEHVLLARLSADAPGALASSEPEGSARRVPPVELAHPILRRRLVSPLPLFEADVDAASLAWLRSHEVFGLRVAPGTLFLELADAAARQVLGEGRRVVIHDVSFGEPLVLTEGVGSRSGQVVVQDKGGDRVGLGFHTLDEGAEGEAGRWRLHLNAEASAELRPAADEPFDRREIELRCGEPMDGDRFYESIGRTGVRYGPEFRGIRRLWRRRGEALGRIEPATSIEGGYRMHPALLDCCLQVAVAASGIDPEAVREAIAYMPVGVDRMELDRAASGALWCHATLHTAAAPAQSDGPTARLGSEAPAALPDTLVADLVAFDDAGRRVAALRGLYLKRALREAVERALVAPAPNDLYVVRWRPLPTVDGRPASSTTPARRKEGRWLCVGAGPGAGGALAAALTRRGISCDFVPAGSASGSRSRSLEEALAQLRGEGAEALGVLFVAEPIGRVPTPERLAEAQVDGSGTLLSLLPILTGHGGTRALPLLLVTRGVTPAGADSAALDPANAPLLGLGKVLAQEHPELSCVRIDLEPGEADAERDAEAVQAVMELGAGEDQLASREGRLHVPRLVQAPRGRAVDGPTMIVRPDASYLVTGGLGGIGLQLARWLGQRGARHLVLLGRSARMDDERVGPALAELRAMGVAVEVVEADVGVGSPGSPLARLFERFGRSLPPLKGVIHAAGVLDDGALLRMEWERFEGVLRPKVSGAWNLHLLTRELELDFFVLFSSVATLFGLPGQGNYGAANAFLDALAHARRREGLPALAIAWGAWSEVGAVARHRHGDFVAAAGVVGFSTARGIELLEQASALGDPHVAAVRLDVKRLLSRFEPGAEPPLLRELAGERRRDASARGADDAGGQSGGGAPLEELKRLPGDSRPSWMSNHLRRRIAQLLRLRPEEIPEAANLIQVGLDSLMFLNLVRTLGEDFHVKLVPHKAFEEPTVNGLSHRLLEDLFPGGEGAREDAPARGGGGGGTVLDGPTPVAPGAGGLGLLREDPAHRFEPFPLTDIQHAYWIGRSGGFDMGNVAGHVFYELDATDLDLARLMGAWRLLISRHEMLRAVIEPDGTQRILERVPEFEPRVLDLRAVESREAERRLAEIRAGMSCQALQVDRWPLFDLRATLLPDRIRLHIDLDLLVADLASAQILLGDLIRLYLEPEVPLAPLALSFRDCVLATKAAESSEEFASARRYWLDRLDTLPPAPRLPLRVDPASVSSPRSRRRSFRLEAEGWRRLKERASRAGLTPSSLLAAAYAEVLHRWSGSPHFTINVTLFSRPAVHPEVGGIVGDFTSVNLLEVRFDGGRSFQERALALQQRLVTDLGHRQFSGVRVLRELARERASRAEAIMPVVFTSAVGLGEHGPEDTLGMLGTIVHSITQTPQVWLDYQAMEQGGGLLCNWDAVEELFPPGLLDDMFDAHSSRLLRLARAD